MDNLDLRKYLAEGRLLKESNNTVRVYISDLDKEVDIDISGATKIHKCLIDYAIEIEEFPTIEDAEGMFGQLMDINSEEEVAYYYEFDRGFEDDQEDVWKLAMLAYRDGKVLDSHEPSQVTYDGEDFDDLVDDDDLESLGIFEQDKEEFLFINSDGEKVYKDEKGLYYIEKNPFNPGEKLYYHPDYPPTKMSDKKVIKSLELTPLQNYIFNYELDISDDVDMKAIKRLKNADDVYNYYANVRGWEGTDLEDDLNNIYDQVKVKFG